MKPSKISKYAENASGITIGQTASISSMMIYKMNVLIIVPIIIPGMLFCVKL